MLQTIKLMLEGYLSWKPTKYRPYATSQWNSGGSGMYSRAVYIKLDDTYCNGSFYCTKNWCEIRTGRIKMIVPIKNVKFYQKIKHDDLTDSMGQFRGYDTWEEIIAVVKEYSSEDIKRWTRWKKKKHKPHSKHQKH